jgi:hypothetical protein
MIIHLRGRAIQAPEPAFGLHELDADTETAVSAGDGERCHDAYDRLRVRTEGTRLRAERSPTVRFTAATCGQQRDRGGQEAAAHSS